MVDEAKARSSPHAALIQKRAPTRLQQLLREAQAIARKADFLAVWLVPSFAFCMLTVLFTYGFMELPSLCVMMGIVVFAAGAFLVVIRKRGHIWLPLGLALLMAAFTGSAVGLFVYDAYSCFPTFYANSRIYTNVVPSQPSAAVADAGKLTFTSEAGIDAKHSVAYVNEFGQRFCIAPIRDHSGSAWVEFWAVGIDCCDAPGQFTCDQASDPDAKAGIRIFDNSGFFHDSHKDFFRKAQQKAEASFGLASASEQPMYIRWVRQDNLDMLSNEYQVKAACSLVFANVMFMLVSAGLSFASYRPRL